MTRKHFIAIAEVLKQTRKRIVHAEDLNIFDDCIVRMADRLQLLNPLFDRRKFIEKCRED